MKVFPKLVLSAFVGMSVAGVLSACGGGGTGTAGTPLLGSKNTNTATLQWLAQGQLNPSLVPMNVPVTVVYKLLDPYQHPMPGKVVTFYTNPSSSVQCFTQTTPPTYNPSCSAVTDSNGMAQVILQAAPLNAQGTIYPSVSFSVQVITSQVPTTVSPSASTPFNFASAVQYSQQTTLISDPIGWSFIPLQ
ncbi:MAG: hypothetical protein RBR52_03425 [Thiomonas sp.]|uniref:hypothetical protein n=1 Tax=Thiomonas sp. TaxID=2047785 RepID=UPI002A36195A|nr:hypothetical protein [Thiomonas sp.]MDY0329532.1 hypothetical protein [Thiomonas sp.]